MTHKQLRSILSHLNLAQNRCAFLLGVSERGFRRWTSGESSIPEPVAIVLQLLLSGKITIEDIDAARHAMVSLGTAHQAPARV